MYSSLAKYFHKIKPRYILPLVVSVFLFATLILQDRSQNSYKQWFNINHGNYKENFELSLSKNKTNSLSFASLMRSFPWKNYQNVIKSNDMKQVRLSTEHLLTSILIPLVIKEPLIPVNNSCVPSLLSEPYKIPCCSALPKPRKIGVLLNFGFDVDALEVHLHELDSLADKFFLVESTKVHNNYLDSKPSIWDLIKYTPRFSRFEDKIIHFVIDDADLSVNLNNTDKIWNREYTHAQLRLKKFLEWNNSTEYFGPDDLIGVGDTDEIPNRNTINFLKHCEIHKSGAVDIGIWFPMPFADTLYRSDYPVPSHPYTLGNPTYWTLTALQKLYNEHATDIPGRRAGQGDSFLLGGMHFSSYPYLPFQLIKLLTGTESGLRGIKAAFNIGIAYLSNNSGTEEELDDRALKKWEKIMTKGKEHKIDSLREFKDRFNENELNSIMRLPWFYECNPDRYAGYFRKRDLRLNGVRLIS